MSQRRMLWKQTHRRNESVDEALLGLAVSPNSSERLLVGSWVPIGVEEDEPVGTDEVDTAPSSLGTEEEDKLASVGVVEMVDELLSLGDSHRSVQSQAGVLAVAAESLEEVERLRVVADEDDLVRRLGSKLVQEPAKEEDTAHQREYCGRSSSRKQTHLSRTRNFPPYSAWTIFPR